MAIFDIKTFFTLIFFLLPNFLAAESINKTVGGVCDGSCEGKDKSAMQDILCKLPQIGQQIVLSKENTGLSSGQYRLTRLSEKQYRVDIRVSFYPEADYDGKVSDEKVPREYKNKVKKCLKNYAPYLKGPNGESLEIKLSEDKQVPMNLIAIRGSGERSNSGEYESDINCPTILHETLHLLGLEDEYKETLKGYIVDPASGRVRHVSDGIGSISEYNCRSLGPSNSVMSNQEEAIESIFPTFPYKRRACECGGEDVFCRKYTKENINSLWKLKDCPKGFILKTQIIEVPDYERLAKMNDEPWFEKSGMSNNYNQSNYGVGNVGVNYLPMGTGMGGFGSTGWSPPTKYSAELPLEMYPKVFLIAGNDDGLWKIPESKRSKRDSILLPAHFRIITKPLCKEENKIYLTCTENSYRTKIHAAGKEKKCFDVPPICNQPEEWLK